MGASAPRHTRGPDGLPTADNTFPHIYETTEPLACEAYHVGAFERFKVVNAAIIQLPYMRMRYEFSKPPNETVHRSESLCASISSDFHFPRQ